MKEGGLLEVLLVNAEGIRHTNLVGKHHQASWNEKFKFEFPISDWKRLSHLKLKIMDKELFAESGFVGESIIQLGGIVTEGCELGHLEVKPSPYNVLLEDDTYKGQVKIGFKFITSKEEFVEIERFAGQDNESKQSVLATILRLWEKSWWRFLFRRSKNQEKTS
ncbi:hypothetical protein ACFE04_016742 [Oxalis oulophora]